MSGWRGVMHSEGYGRRASAQDLSRGGWRASKCDDDGVMEHAAA